MRERESVCVNISHLIVVCRYLINLLAYELKLFVNFLPLP